jgi:cyclic dehypoxanthinyl futalosine synthase
MADAGGVLERYFPTHRKVRDEWGTRGFAEDLGMGISREQALDCFRSDDLIGIGMEADAVRRKLHPEGVVSYSIECAVDCKGLDLRAAMADAEAIGAAGLVLRGGASMELEGLERLLGGVPEDMWVQGLAAAEVLAIAAQAGVTLEDALARLRDAGLNAIGDGAGEVVDEDWLRVHNAAHQAGMRTTAAMLFGGGESLEQRVQQLEAVRLLQAETGGIAAFVPLCQRVGRELDEATAVEYLKTLAVARMYLDNVENVQSDWTTQGVKVLQMGLRFGANDVGSVGARATEEELQRVIRDAGFRPAQRDVGYRAMMLG